MGKFTFQVLAPDGEPVSMIGIHVAPESMQHVIQKGPHRAWGHTTQDGLVSVNLTPNETERLVVTLTPWTIIRNKNISRPIAEAYKDATASYAVAESYSFAQAECSRGQIGEITLLHSVKVQFQPVSEGKPVSSVGLLRVGGAYTGFPALANADGAISVTVPRATESVIYVSHEAVVKRLVVTAQESVKDVDLGEVILQLPEDVSHAKITAQQGSRRLIGLTFVSPDASTIISYGVDASSADEVVNYNHAADDRFLLGLPSGEYYVFRHIPRSQIDADYDVPAAIERIAAGKDPGIDHAMIEIVEGEIREFRIDVDPDTGNMTATRER